MRKFTIKKTQAFILLAIILVLGTLLFWLINRSGDDKLPTSGYFKIIDNPNTIIYSQDVSELNVTPQAVVSWQQKIKELEATAPNITDELERKRYYNDIAVYLGYVGRYQDAYEYFIKSLDISYIDRVTWLQLGDLLVKMKAYQSAEQAYIKGNDINPYEQLNYIKLADLYALIGKSESEVVAVYDQGIGKIDKATALFQAKAYYYEQKKNYTEALKVYEIWLKNADEAGKANVEERISSLKAKI